MINPGSEDYSLFASARDPVGYYGLPVIHRPHWKWLIICYFFLGGVSGTSAVLAAVARLTKHQDGPRIARVATYVSMGSLLPCPVLLILDLGRPARFLNMLRTFRLSSPMSVGSWGLVLFSAVLSTTTLLQLLIDFRGRGGDAEATLLDLSAKRLAPACAGLGFLVSGYTGVLLAATAVPIWSKRPWLLGPLFLASATSSGTAAIALAFSLVDPPTEAGERTLNQFEAVVVMAETVILTGWIYALGATAKPATSGHVGAVLRHLVVGLGMAAPQLLAIKAHKVRNWQTRLNLNRAASVFTLFGGFALRYAVVQAGRDSADDPQATFDMTSG